MIGLLNVLVACEESATVRDAFRRRGHNAWSCDLTQTRGDPRWHVVADAREVAYYPRKFGIPQPDLLIAHPPCTRLANSGVRWLHERNLWADLDAAAALFNDLRNAPIERRGTENPVPHKYARALIGRYTQCVQPWMFGHRETKATCFWLDNLPPLTPTRIVGPPKTKAERKEFAVVHRTPPGPNRERDRSKTYQGIADAMAEQWGAL